MDQLANVEEYSAVAAELVDIGVQYGVTLLSALAILVAGFVLAGWASRLLRRRLEAVRRFDRTLIPILGQIVRYAVLAFTFVLVLAEFGVQTASIIALLGAAGLAIGLALQGTLQNVAAGLMILILRPFQLGDYVDTAAGSGTVEEIGLFITQLRTAHGIFMALPNAQIWSGSITNYSRNATRRLDLPVGISYGDDIDRAREVLLDLARKEERVLDDPEPIAIVTGYGESSVDLQLRVWIKVGDFWDTNWALTRAAKYALDRAGITIPYPHRHVITVQEQDSQGQTAGGRTDGGRSANDRTARE